MSETEANVTPPETTAEEKKGRGPTRAAVKFADLVDDVAKLHPETRKELLVALADGGTAKVVREDAKAQRKALREYVTDKEAAIAILDELAALLARVEELPPSLRLALPVTIRAGEE